MQETIFRPKYSVRWNWDVLSLSLGLLIVFLFSFLKFGITLSNIVLLIILIFFIAYFSPLYIRRIVFASSFFIVEKYLWSSKKIEYSDVVYVGMSKVKTRKDNVSFAGMSNSDELHSLFRELIKQGKINHNQLEKKIVVEEIIFRKSIRPSLIIFLPLAVLLFYFWPFYRHWSSTVGLSIAGGLIFYAVNFVIRLILKKRLDDNQAG